MNQQTILKVLSSIEIIESNGGDNPYLLAENSGKNRQILTDAGIATEKIDKATDGDTIELLSLATNGGYADYYDPEDSQFKIKNALTNTEDPQTKTRLSFQTVVNLVDRVNIAIGRYYGKTDIEPTRKQFSILKNPNVILVLNIYEGGYILSLNTSATTLTITKSLLAKNTFDALNRDERDTVNRAIWKELATLADELVFQNNP